MKRIITHPDNVATLRSMCEAGRFDCGIFTSIQIHANPHMQRDKPTGRYRLPDGRCVEREQIEVRERFVEYGPDDLEYLLLAGMVTEEHEPLFYLVDESLLMRMFDSRPIMPPPFRYVVDYDT